MRRYGVLWQYILDVAPVIALDPVAELTEQIIRFGAELPATAAVFVNAEDFHEGDTIRRSVMRLRDDARVRQTRAVAPQRGLDPRPARQAARVLRQICPDPRDETSSSSSPTCTSIFAPDTRLRSGWTSMPAQSLGNLRMKSIHAAFPRTFLVLIARLCRPECFQMPVSPLGIIVCCHRRRRASHVRQRSTTLGANPALRARLRSEYWFFGLQRAGDCAGS